MDGGSDRMKGVDPARLAWAQANPEQFLNAAHHWWHTFGHPSSIDRDEVAADAFLAFVSMAPPKSGVPEAWVQMVTLRCVTNQFAKTARQRGLLDQFGGDNNGQSANPSSQSAVNRWLKWLALEAEEQNDHVLRKTIEAFAVADTLEEVRQYAELSKTELEAVQKKIRRRTVQMPEWLQSIIIDGLREAQ